MYQKSQSYDVWFLRYRVRRINFFVILGPFLSFYHSYLLPPPPPPPPLPPNYPKNQNFEEKKKMKRMPGHIILLTYKCTINEDHMIYGPWNIRWDRQKFSLFWDISSPFSPLKTWKIKILTLKKTPGYIIILHICTVNDNHMMYSSWHMEQDRHNFL